MNIRQETFLDKVFNTVSVIILLILGLVTLYPFYYLLIYSLNEPMDAMRGGLYFLPRKFSLISYRLVWAAHDIGPAAFISLSRTAAGTAFSLFFTSMLAYVLSRPRLIGRKFFNRLFVITIYVGGGLIPWYLTLRAYGFTNTFLVYIIPGAIGVFNMILIRTYIQELPTALWESAEVDGANEFIIFIRIIFPLCVPVLAVVCIFTAVGQWNSWFDAAVFNASRRELHPLQMILMGLLKSAVVRTSRDIPLSNSTRISLTPESIRAAITIIATAPIVIVYPFFQKHFTQGIMLGSVKG
jgi:putative aldouronate transport system permease protein